MELVAARFFQALGAAAGGVYSPGDGERCFY